MEMECQNAARCWPIQPAFEFLLIMCPFGFQRISFISILLLSSSISCHHLRNKSLIMRAEENIKSIWLANCVYSFLTVLCATVQKQNMCEYVMLMMLLFEYMLVNEHHFHMCAAKKRGWKNKQTNNSINCYSFSATFHTAWLFKFSFIYPFHSTYFLNSNVNAFLLMCSIYIKIAVSLSLSFSTFV